MNGFFAIKDKEIKRVELFTELPLLLRLDVCPFIMFYLTAIGVVMLNATETTSESVYLTFCIPLAACHVVVFLISQWSTDIHFWLAYSRVSSIDRATALKVFPTLADAPKKKCPVVKTSTTYSFTYQQILFCYDPELKSFEQLQYLTDQTIESYVKSQGYANDKQLQHAINRWGLNEFEIPLPPFMELFKEHAVAPFFVFQMFCVLLWCLDEYVYYSLMTMVMLIIFECTVVKQRQRSMMDLRRMQRPPQPCCVYRSRKWQVISSAGLVPGDIVSIRKSSALAEGHDNNEQLVPCDVILLQGSCVVNEAMLSGESIPLRKSALTSELYDSKMNLQVDEGTSMLHKKHVVYGGTKVLQHNGEGSKFPKSPDAGCPAFVLRTGFGTTQGNLMRTILYSSERMSANNAEALWFISFLLIFAIGASAMVLLDGWNDPLRSRFKLVLHCIMIITSVVPPELPMELSMAVNNSLIALTKLQVFCTEPFRIPFAGKVACCCFDKTGTLTSDELFMNGVTAAKFEDEEDTALNSPDELSLDVQLVLAGCHSLVMMNGKLAGDPLEKTVVSEIAWTFNKDDCAFPPPGAKLGLHLKILQRYSFSSALKRMSTILGITKTSGEKSIRVVTKGAPETMAQFFTAVPKYYDEVQRFYTAKGCRVLALGYRELKVEANAVRKLKRDEVEKDLTFCGLLVLECPLKADTKKTIKDLLKSKHQVKMLTGDNALTACDVARQVYISQKGVSQTLILKHTTGATVEWIGIDPSVKPIKFNEDGLKDLASEFDLCVTGPALGVLVDGVENVADENDKKHIERYSSLLGKIAPFVTVFARTSPKQKEYILRALNRYGVTAMCGDGTNDVGALKQAHVGVSIINNPELEENLLNAKKKNKAKSPEERLRQLELTQNQHVNFGDASIASPFTSKSPSIKVMKDIIRQGRCTLVTTIQMFKILGVNCLITAYMLSVLFLHGVKQGDQQVTVFGIVVALFFMFLSFSKPAKKLSTERPPNGIFCYSVFLSIMGQFIIHISCLMAAVEAGKEYMDFSDPSLHPDGHFQPSVINSVVFLMASTMQLNTFVVNYRGMPFMQSFWSNKLLSRGAVACYVVLLVVVFEAFPPINALLELVEFPTTDLQTRVLQLMAVDSIGVFCFEQLVRRLS